MEKISMSFDEFLTLKALKFKAEVSGSVNNEFFHSIIQKDPDAFGMKNMCFRIHPFMQARFEATLDALGMSKQEALTEMLSEFLNQIDDKLTKVGLGPIGYEKRLRELGYELGEADSNGQRSLTPIPAPKVP